MKTKHGKELSNHFIVLIPLMKQIVTANEKDGLQV